MCQGIAAWPGRRYRMAVSTASRRPVAYTAIAGGLGRDAGVARGGLHHLPAGVDQTRRLPLPEPDGVALVVRQRFELDLRPGGPELLQLRDAYLEPFSAYGSVDELRTQFNEDRGEPRHGYERTWRTSLRSISRRCSARLPTSSPETSTTRNPPS